MEFLIDENGHQAVQYSGLLVNDMFRGPMDPTYVSQTLCY